MRHFKRALVQNVPTNQKSCKRKKIILMTKTYWGPNHVFAWGVHVQNSTKDINIVLYFKLLEAVIHSYKDSSSCPTTSVSNRKRRLSFTSSLRHLNNTIFKKNKTMNTKMNWYIIDLFGLLEKSVLSQRWICRQKLA